MSKVQKLFASLIASLVLILPLVGATSQNVFGGYVATSPILVTPPTVVTPPVKPHKKECKVIKIKFHHRTYPVKICHFK